MNPIFPATYSTLSSTSLAVFLTKNYGLPDVKCHLLVRGVADTYLVETPSVRYILRIYRSSHRSLSEIQAEIALLLALKNAAVRVSYPIADLSGNFIQAIAAAEGLRHAVLFTYAPGEVAAILSEKQLCKFGHQMAAFHNVSSTLKLDGSRWQINLETTLFEPLELIRSFFDHDKENFDWLLKHANEVKKYLSSLDTAGFSTGYCHFDFLSKNFHFDENDEPTFFDFDFFGHGWLINDIMTFHQQLCLDVFAGRLTKGSADHYYATFIKAYREKRTLTNSELAAIPGSVLASGFFIWDFIPPTINSVSCCNPHH